MSRAGLSRPIMSALKDGLIAEGATVFDYGCGRGGDIQRLSALGYDADFTIVDLAARRKITAAEQANKSGWTPFDGFEARAWPMATIIRGQIVMRDGALVEAGKGEPIRFLETLVR